MSQLPFGPAAPRAVPAELDRDTLDRCRRHDPVAFRAFVVRYQRPVFACLSRIVGPGPHVEDLAQDVFLRAYRAMPTFDPDLGAKPSTWLLTIATRAALDARKRRVIPLRPLDDADQVAHGSTPETEATRAELAKQITVAVESLSDEQRAALVLAEFHGFSMSEIASAMGIPEATAKTRLFRARERMRAVLGDAWREP
ncbi:MAG TPA: sigma-70 family RNA polymerase sigma factor [Polyangiaceae bacterium]